MKAINRSHSTRKTGYWLAASVAAFVILAAYIYTASFKAPYIGIQLKPVSGSDWLIEAIEENGKAAGWEIETGDRIVHIAASPEPKLINTGTGAILSKAGLLVVEKQDGRRLELQGTADMDTIAQTAYSLAIALLLLAIGGYAVYTMPESRVIRLFYLLNWTMALCILTEFSNEKSISEIVMTFCAIWLPYLLLSFYFLFVFRTIHSRFKKLQQSFLIYSTVFSALIVYFIFSGRDVSGWVVNLLNFTILGTLALLAGVTFARWNMFDRMERNQLLILFSGLYLSLMPYTLLYAFPKLVYEDEIVPIKYTLVGLIPFSGTIAFLLVKRSMLDVRIYVPRLLIHSLYLSAAFTMFAAAAKGLSALELGSLFILFLLLTYAYHKSLLRFHRKAEQRDEWLERQTLLLSRRLGTKNSGNAGTSVQILLEAQQAERIRTTYFLHDHLLQNLIFLSRDLEELHDTGIADKEQIAIWLKCVYDSQRDIRTLCDDLYPHIIDKGDLKEALQWLMRTMREKGDIRIELKYELEESVPANELIKINLFRAIREFVHNVFKHSQASAMSIRLWKEQQTIHCQITDNGKGFDAAAAFDASPAGARRFGLLTVHSQIRHLGGNTDIASSPGKGTVVTVSLPLELEVRNHA